MAFNQALYNELYNLRQGIKDREKRKHGRMPTVCSDNALKEIMELCPKKLEDFRGISGIGENFINNYGEDFLAVVLKHTQVQTEKKVNMGTSAVDTLKELEKKLVNINRKNRLLYMPKLSNKYAFDMFELGEKKLNELLFDKDASITVANISDFSGSDFQKESTRFKRVVQLLREVNKDLRDKGQNDLYIGYPYAIGRMSGENFDVRAPLVLFPVTADKTATTIKISLDETRDVVFNNTLVLAFYKFNNVTKPLPSDVVEKINEKGFVSAVLDFYKDSEIYIKGQKEELEKLREFRAEDFPRFQNGELYLENCAVLGKFPICSSSIQKDFDEILKNNEVNTLLNDLLVNSGENDYYSDSYDEKEVKCDDKKLTISERNLVYINELNSSQEAVLSAIDSYDALVVQGPPGTGKSQVITNLISKFVSNGQIVLMVSEKKTALDVVYSRLGELSQYALLIDDVGNKQAFYQQLSKMVELGKPMETSLDLTAISGQIDEQVKRLEEIADVLYTPGDFGIEPYKLYLKSKRCDATNTRDKKRREAIRNNRDIQLVGIPYAELENIHHKFCNTTLCRNLEEYVDITQKYHWMKEIRGDLSEYDIYDFVEQLRSVKTCVDDWKAKNVIVRIFSKGNVTKKIKEILRTYFTTASKNLVNLLLKEIDKVIESVDSYILYQERKPVYAILTEKERMYVHSLINIKKDANCGEAEANDELFNELICEQIGRFEAKNRLLFQKIDDFDSIIQALSEAIGRKQKLSRERLEALLMEGMYNISTSKRHKDILHALESRRKWSVNKFIKKFDFELFKSVKIWLLTPEVVSEIIPLQTGIFDLVVFDEASQMYVEKGIPSILRAKKVIVAGDHKQLRPSNLGGGRTEMDVEEIPEDEELKLALEEKSLLDLARFQYRDVLLNFHYRSKYEELIAFSNHAFYKGRLYVAPNATPPSRPPIEVHKMEDAIWANRANVVEAKYIVQMLKRFFEERTDGETIGIITFNSSQRDLIDDLIDDECAIDSQFAASVRGELMRKKNGEDIGLFVKNIESVQGDERDVIIFSIGYAKNENGRLVRNFGWLNQEGGENRLNVAISRAKKKIHIVTSFVPAELQVEDMKNDGPRILKKYLEYAFAVSAGDKAGAKDILHSFGDEKMPGQTVSFDSDFENQVYDALKEVGYTVDTQVGIGGYSIDLAIKKNGQYILGIECDGRLYHSSKAARERDYHRQKYLESRGWRIYRIWSTNWWKNPQKEIRKIMAVVDSISE